MEILTCLANSICKRFEEQGVVVPLTMKTHVFITAAMDNLDHNPSSTSAKNSFHGTAITLTNHLSSLCLGHAQNSINYSNDSTVPSYNLPDSYAIVSPASLTKNEITVYSNESYCRSIADLHQFLSEENEWCNIVKELLKIDSLHENESISWAVYNASLEADVKKVKANISIMPLFNESANTVAMVRYAINLSKFAIEHINPMQTPVEVMDQPLFSLAKQI